MNAAPRRAVFWDRDGTLMEEVHYCRRPEDVRAIPGAGASLAALSQEGWLNLVITNQSGIARGLLTLEEFHAVNEELFRQLGCCPDRVYFAPDDPACPSPRRKPGTGMLEEAARDFSLELKACFVVGDKDCDIECGRAAGCRTILVLTGYGSRYQDCGADYVCPSAAEAASLILGKFPIPS